jgi:hypothetical protein
MNLTYLIVPFLIAGYITLDYLFALKENHKKFGKLHVGFRNHPHSKSGVYFVPKMIVKMKG